MTKKLKKTTIVILALVALYIIWIAGGYFQDYYNAFMYGGLG